MAKKQKKHTVKPDFQGAVAGASLILEGWQYWEEGLGSKERGQKRLYQKENGSLPIMFKPGTTGYKQFTYTPQQKRKGVIPKEVLPNE